jgi:acyl carrier protein
LAVLDALKAADPRTVFRPGEFPSAGAKPADYLEAALGAHYQAELDWSAVMGAFDVRLWRPGEPAPCVQVRPASFRYFNTPSADLLHRDLAQELSDFLGSRLPAYMVPRRFMIADALPLTANGKLDRARLPVVDLQVDSAEYIEPSTPLENALAEIWQDLLGLERVGVSDNFFALGGHSLLATRLVVRLRETFGLEIPLRTIFEHPSITALVDHILSLLEAELVAQE